MSENEKEEGGIALSEIFHIIFSQKWILITILVVLTLGGTLGIYYGKNAFSRVYEVSFTLELPKTGKGQCLRRARPCFPEKMPLSCMIPMAFPWI